MTTERVGIGLAQIEPVLGDLVGNRVRSVEAIERAASQGAGLIVLPELCNSGYNFASSEEVAVGAEPVPGPTSDAWVDAARRTGAYIAGGICEREDDRYYNSVVMVGSDGLIGIYRKLHLFDREHLYFVPGNRGLPVFDLPFGRVGIMVCYDLRFVETTRILCTQGADLIAVPTNWVPTFNQHIDSWDTEGHCPQGRIAAALAGLNQVYIAAADRVGTERGLRFLGASLLVGPFGNILLGPLSKDEPSIAVCELTPTDARDARTRGERLRPYDERRIDVYSEHLGYMSETWQ